MVRVKLRQGTFMQYFQHKVAAITGAGSGIGQQLALLLAQQGCDLALSDIDASTLAQTLELLHGTSVKVTTAQVNVAQLDEVRAWAAQTQQQHGKVNFIFNNAGVALASTVEGASYADLQWIVDINFWGVVYGTKEFLPLIKQAGEGHVVNISSLFGLTAQPTQSAYNATKFAVRGYTESLRQELDLQNCGVSALCVHPGGIRTNIANAARVNDSLTTLGMNPENSARSFNRLLRCPAEDAARQILQAVKKNQRRLLIGNDAKVLDLIQRIFPSGYQKLLVLANKFSQSSNRS